MIYNDLTDDQLAELVVQHRNEAVRAEADLKESFYLWETAYFMKYQQKELGIKKPQTKMGRSTQYIGYLHAQIETAVARSLAEIMRRMPPFIVEPEGGRTMEDAEAVRALHAHSIRMSRLRAKLRQALRYVYIYGTAPIKVFWDEKWLRKGQLVPFIAGENEDGSRIWDFKEQEESILQYAGPDCAVVDPYCFHVAPRSDDIYSARWVQEEFIRSEDYIRERIADGTYQDIDWTKLKDDEYTGGGADHFDYQERRRETMGTPSGNNTASENEITPKQYYVLEEWQDGARITVIGRTNPQILKRSPNPFGHRQKPYIVLRYIDFANEFWGISMSRQLEGPQSELNLIRRLRSDAVLAQLQNMWRVAPSAEQTLSEEDFRFRPNGIIIAEKDEIEPLHKGDLPIFAYKEEDVIRVDGDIVSGITDIFRGGAPASTTATVGQINANFASNRLGLVLDSISDGLEEMMWMRHALYQQFVTQDQVVKTVGADGLKSILVSIDQIVGDYSFTFYTGRNIGNRELARSQLMQGMTMCAQNPVLASMTNWKDLLVDFWAMFESLHNTQRYVLDPMKPKMTQQSEIMVMALGEPVGVSPLDPHEEHLQVIQQLKQSDEWRTIPPEGQQLISAHEAEHIPFYQAQLAASGSGNSGSPERANVGNALNTGEVLAQNNRFTTPRL